MNPAQLLVHFDRISEAPDAIPRLRRLILDLAVRGKLVEQDPKDEPVSELLKRIQEKKEYLVKKGEYRRQKPLSDVSDGAATFQVPKSWRWTRLGAVTNITQGFAFSSENFSSNRTDGLPLIRIGDIGSNKPNVFIRGEYEAAYLVKRGDLLLGLSGSIKCATWEGPNALLNQRIARIAPVPNGLNPQWLLFCVEKCIEIWISETSKLTVQNVKAAQLYEAVIPLPPLAEQHRIVAKVDELMALCNRLEAAQTKRERRRDSLVAASLSRLNTGADPQSLREYFRFHFSQLPRLTTRPAHIQQLRQTILNLAVRGQLVPQDPNDKPASELITQIAYVRKRLMAAKEFRESTSATNSIDKRGEVAIPRTWAWAKCKDILFVTKLAGFEYTKHFNLMSKGDIPVIRAQNVRPWNIDQKSLLYIDMETSEILSRSALTKPCLLMTFIGAGIGDVAIFHEKTRWHLAPNVAKIEVLAGCEDQLDLEYLILFLNSPFGRAEIFKHMKATAQPSISMGTIRDIDIALPPLAEQHRIVAKVDQLMKFCDELESKLMSAQTESSRFLEAALHETLRPALEEET